MGTILDKLKREKPWVIMGASRLEYETAKPWKKANMSRSVFERIICALTPEMFKEIKLHADVEMLMEGAFGKDVVNCLDESTS